MAASVHTATNLAVSLLDTHPKAGPLRPQPAGCA